MPQYLPQKAQKAQMEKAISHAAAQRRKERRNVFRCAAA
jgi:hypothetical protein